MRIRAVIAAGGGALQITEIKEKYGTLRIHWRGALSPDAAARVEECVDLAEARSAVTCEVCGEPGVLRGGGWLTTRCAAHAEGRPAIEVDEGFENLQVERRLVGGRVQVRFRFYDRAGDRFVEVGRRRRDELRAALVQASLDPIVRSISHVAVADVGSAPVEVDAMVVVRDDGRFVLDVVPARQARKFDEEGLRGVALRGLGLASLVVTSDDLAAEPRRSNVDLVWSHRGRAVPIDLRLRILQILADDGPLPLGGLLQAVRSERDPAAAVLSLACDDLVELDLTSGPIGPATVVRTRT